MGETNPSYIDIEVERASLVIQLCSLLFSKTRKRLSLVNFLHSYVVSPFAASSPKSQIEGSSSSKISLIALSSDTA